MRNNECDDDAIDTEMNDSTITKHISLFNEIISNWIQEARKEIAEDTLRSLEENGIDITNDIHRAINHFKECC